MFSDRTIRSMLALKIMRIDPTPAPGSKAIQPASVEFHLGEDIIEVTAEGNNPFALNEKDFWYYTIGPDECLLATTAERLTLPSNIIARVEGKSSWARKFIQVHSTAGFIDPGFDGKITLEIKNIGPRSVTMYLGDAICQVSFDWLDQPAARPYGHPELQSHYQGQNTVTPAYDEEERYA